jgi:hypothetical protein
MEYRLKRLASRPGAALDVVAQAHRRVAEENLQRIPARQERIGLAVINAPGAEPFLPTATAEAIEGGAFIYAGAAPRSPADWADYAEGLENQFPDIPFDQAEEAVAHIARYLDDLAAAVQS